MTAHEHYCRDCARSWPCRSVDCGPRFDAPAVAQMSCPACPLDDPSQDLHAPREALVGGGYRVLPAEGC